MQLISFERKNKEGYIEYLLIDGGVVRGSVNARPKGGDIMLFDLIYQQGYDKFLYNSILIAMKNVPYGRIITADGAFAEYGFEKIDGMYAIDRDKLENKCSCGGANGE